MLCGKEKTEDVSESVSAVYRWIIQKVCNYCLVLTSDSPPHSLGTATWPLTHSSTVPMATALSNSTVILMPTNSSSHITLVLTSSSMTLMPTNSSTILTLTSSNRATTISSSSFPLPYAIMQDCNLSFRFQHSYRLLHNNPKRSSFLSQSHSPSLPLI